MTIPDFIGNFLANFLGGLATLITVWIFGRKYIFSGVSKFIKKDGDNSQINEIEGVHLVDLESKSEIHNLCDLFTKISENLLNYINQIDEMKFDSFYNKEIENVTAEILIKCSEYEKEVEDAISQNVKGYNSSLYKIESFRQSLSSIKNHALQIKKYHPDAKSVIIFDNDDMSFLINPLRMAIIDLSGTRFQLARWLEKIEIAASKMS